MIASNIKDFFLVLRMQNRQAWYHKKAAIGMIMSWSVRVGLTILLYKGVYELIGRESVNHTTLPVAISSMILYAICLSFSGRDIYWTIQKEYRTGGIEIWLNKPVSYLTLKSAENLGKCFPIACGIILTAISYWSVYGLPHSEMLALRIAGGTILLIMGVLIMTLLYMLVGLSVAWLEDSRPLFEFTDKSIMIFGGIYVPISFFSPFWRYTGEILPFGSMMSVTQIFYPDFPENLPRFIVTQLIWAIVLFLAVRKVNHMMQANLAVNGG